MCVPRAAAVDRAAPARYSANASAVRSPRCRSRPAPGRAAARRPARSARRGPRSSPAAAAEEGLRMVAGGTPVLGRDVPRRSPQGPRQDRGNATFRGLHDELAHLRRARPRGGARPGRAVLVEQPPAPVPADADRARGQLAVLGRARHRLRELAHPAVAALAGGRARRRTSLPRPTTTSSSPRCSRPARWSTSGTVFWDIRPSANHPTLEVRVADVPITAAGVGALRGAGPRAGGRPSRPLVDRGDAAPQLSRRLMRLAYWRSARDGLGGDGVDLRTGRRAARPRSPSGCWRPTAGAGRRRRRRAGSTAGWHDLAEGGAGRARQRAAARAAGPPDRRRRPPHRAHAPGAIRETEHSQ